MSAWGALPRDILALIFQRLQHQVHGRPITSAARALWGPLHVNRHWQQVARAELELHLLWVDLGAPYEARLLQALAGTVRVAGLCLGHDFDSDVRYCTLCDTRTRPSCLPCTKQRSAQQRQAGFDAVADERLQQLLAATLEHLAGAPWQRRRWKRHAWPGATFLLHPFTRLRRLQVSQCYSPVGKQAPAPVRVGGACWEQHEYLEDLEVHGPAEVTGLPPRLRRLAVWGGPVTAELAVLARCPCVELNCGQHHSFGVCFYTPGTDHTEPLAMGEGASGEQQAYYLAEAAALAGSEGCPALRRLEVRCRHLCFLDVAGSFRSMSHTSARSARITSLACAVGDTSLAIDFGFQSEFQGQYAAVGPMARLVLACEPPPVVAGTEAALVH